MKTIYLFSGLGADERVFQFMEFPGHKVEYIKWIKPVQNESIATYAKRIAEQVSVENPVLIGLSFGGIMAIEVSKLIKTRKIIIIASVKNRSELPFYFRFAKYLPLHQLIPAALLKYPNVISYWLFGTESKTDKRMLATILKDTDSLFLKWAIDKIVNWENKSMNEKLIHIHGGADKVLPVRFVDANIIIEGGGHLMTLNKAKEINEVLDGLLK